MKSILAFLLGAVVAAALVYYAVRPKPAAEPVAQQTVTTVKTAPQASPEVPASTPERDAVPAVWGRETKPAAASSARPVRANPGLQAKTAKPSGTEAPAKTVAAAPGEAPRETAQAAPAAPALPPPAPLAPPPPVVERKPEPRQPSTVTIPAGTMLNVRVDQTLSSERNASGDSFRATLDTPLIVDGMAVAERGARVQGRVVEVDRSGRVSGLARLSLELTSLNTADGQRVRVQTEPFARQAERTTKSDALKVGAAAGIGAAIGAIAGGGKGAGIGAAAGGAAGTGGVLLTRGKEVEVPAETRISFRTSQPITVTEKLQ